MNRDVAVSDEIFEQIVANFESRWQRKSPPAIEDFVEPDIPTNRELLIELIRIDMEFRFGSQLPIRVEEYLEKYAGAKFTSEDISQLAFEEYRLRFQHKENPCKEEFQQRFGISTDQWPVWNQENDASIAHASRITGSQRNRVKLPGIGETFHGFELVGQLGQGAYGAVFLARETELSDRLVAIKLTERSDIEPQSLARLQHTNIIPIYSLKKDDRLQSICMPFLGVATLRDLTGQATGDNSKMKTSGKALISTAVGKRASTIVESVLPKQSQAIGRKLEEGKSSLNDSSPIEGFNYRKTVLWIYSQIADGLAYAHQQGIIHGDLKPGNVLISDAGRPLILDFHLSRMDGDASTGSHVGGTLPYMSSNHLRSLISNTSVSKQCDVFSLGVMLYESLTGQLPYPSDQPGDDLLEGMAKERAQLPLSMRAHERSIPRDLDSIVMRCLSTDGAGYQSANQLHEDLECQLNDLPLRHAPNASLSERFGKWIRRHPRIVSGTSIAAIASLLLVAMSIVAFLWLGHLGKAKAENQSRQFVETLLKSQDEFLDSHEDYQMPSASVAAFDELVESRIGDNVSGYLSSLDDLPQELRKKEKLEVANASYLSAYQKLNASKHVNSAERLSLLENALERLNIAEAALDGRTNAATLGLKSDIFDSLGKHDQATQMRNTLKGKSFPAANRDLLIEAFERYRNGEFEASLDALDELTGANSKLVPGWTLRGRNHEKLGDLIKAELCYSTAISLKPDSAWGYIHRGIIRLKLGNYPLAEEDFGEAIKIDPDSPVTYLNRALCRTKLKNLEAALVDLDFAIENDVLQTRAHYQRHKVLRLLQRDAESAEALKTFMELEPSDEKSWLSRGMAFVRAKQPEQALADFESALNHNPNSIDALQNIATVQSEYLDGPKEAIEAMTLIVEQRPDDNVARVTRGVLLARDAQFDAAKKDAMHAVKRNNSADIYFRAAGVFALTSSDKASDAEIALGLLKKATYKDGRRVLRNIITDKDLDSLRQRKDFIDLIATLESLAGKKK